MTEPYVLGLTGNIATGKSEVARLLSALGARVIDADRVAHEVMAPGGAAYGPVVVVRSGGALAANAMMTAGLIRIGEVANRISSGEANRGVAHATSGPCLQQNLVCVLEGDN